MVITALGCTMEVIITTAGEDLGVGTIGAGTIIGHMADFMVITHHGITAMATVTATTIGAGITVTTIMGIIETQVDMLTAILEEDPYFTIIIWAVVEVILHYHQDEIIQQVDCRIHQVYLETLEIHLLDLIIQQEQLEIQELPLQQRVLQDLTLELPDHLQLDLLIVLGQLHQQEVQDQVEPRVLVLVAQDLHLAV